MLILKEIVTNGWTRAFAMCRPVPPDKSDRRISPVDATLTKDALIEMIRDKVGFPVKEAKEILEIILEEVKLKLEEGKEVKISGFGKWTVKEKRSRPGRNPHTGDRIEISARRVVTFHPSDKLRDSVNKAYAERDGQ